MVDAIDDNKEEFKHLLVKEEECDVGGFAWLNQKHHDDLDSIFMSLKIVKTR